MDSTGSPQAACVLTHGLLLFFFLATPLYTHASQETGSIDGTLKYAFSNVGGWVNFAPAQSRITVTDTGLAGYAWSANDGWINLAPTQSGVKNNGNGTLSGFAWDQAAGWVNFTGVTIDSSGLFHGLATGGTVNGASYAINFDCSTCNVTTDWRPASSRPSSSGGGCAPGFVWNPATISCIPTTGGPYSPVITTTSTTSPSDSSTASNGTSGRTSPIPSSGGVVQQGGNVTPTTTQAGANKPALQTATKTSVATSTTPATKQSFWSSMTFRVVGGVLVLALLGLVWWFFL